MAAGKGAIGGMYGAVGGAVGGVVLNKVGASFLGMTASGRREEERRSKRRKRWMEKNGNFFRFAERSKVGAAKGAAIGGAIGAGGWGVGRLSGRIKPVGDKFDPSPTKPKGLLIKTKVPKKGYGGIL